MCHPAATECVVGYPEVTAPIHEREGSGTGSLFGPQIQDHGYRVATCNLQVWFRDARFNLTYRCLPRRAYPCYLQRFHGTNGHAASLIRR